MNLIKVTHAASLPYKSIKLKKKSFPFQLSLYLSFQREKNNSLLTRFSNSEQLGGIHNTGLQNASQEEKKPVTIYISHKPHLQVPP